MNLAFLLFGIFVSPFSVVKLATTNDNRAMYGFILALNLSMIVDVLLNMFR